MRDQAWWKLFTPDYTPADLASVNAPNPCTLFHPETGIASLVAATTDPVAKGQTRSGKDVVTTERDLKAQFPEARWNAAHLQIIYFGRQHCPARGHVIAACPICAWAMAKATAAAERRRGASK